MLCGQKIKIKKKNKVCNFKSFEQIYLKNYSVLYTFMCYVVRNEHKFRKGNFFFSKDIFI